MRASARIAAAWAARFGLLYLALFILVTQISGSMLPNLTFYYRGLGRLWPLRDLTVWVGRNVFGITGPLEPGNGEPLFFWVQLTWLVAAAALGAAAWMAIDRRPGRHRVVWPWFRLFVRLALAAQLFEYGMTKVIPTQFPAPSLTTLVTPAGDLSLSALLWAAIGSSPGYQVSTGIVEALAAALLLIPRTYTLGAILSLAALGQVFVLNMAFDVGLKLTTLHLMAMALVLLWPDVPRLFDVVLRGRAVPAASADRPPVSLRRSRLVTGLQLAFGLYLLVMYAHINLGFWRVGGGGAPRSALYGIWNVETMAVDGETRAPDLNDYDRRWRRLILDRPGTVVFQRTDDSFATYTGTVDLERGMMELRKGNSRRWSAPFSLERRGADRLILEGEMDERHIRVELRRVPEDTWRLLSSPFRWVRPHE